ncbi:MAG: hypothetical protein FWC27_14860 [Firmicutes bacterium]|nr:hypothetical protein [Bacillota bacterium]
MKHIKKLSALLLCMALGMGVFTFPAAAALEETPPPSKAMSLLYDAGDFAVRGIAGAITWLIPDRHTPREFPESADFLPGHAAFLNAPAPGARWRLGYARASLLEDYDVLDGNHYVTGALDVINKRVPTSIVDDQAIRVTALSDGSGRGAAVFVSLDSYGITSTDVRKIRAALRPFLEAHKVVSLNVSALHQHSVIDTLGMHGPILWGLLANPLANLTGWFAPISGKNPAFMEHLTQVTKNAVMAAVDEMEHTPGTMTYAKADISEFIDDHRAPVSFDPYLHRLCFTPDGGTKPRTWLCNLGLHTTGTGIVACDITGDFPYYMEEIANRAGANFQLINGAELAIHEEGALFPTGSRLEKLQQRGRALGQKLIDLPETGEEEVLPLLNIAHREYVLPVDNPLHTLLARLRVIEANIRRPNPLCTDMEIKTELGYAEFGTSLAAALIPGELEAALAFGDGAGLPAAKAWRGTGWTYTPLQSMAGGRELMVFGLTNDMTGYMPLPNDIHHFVLFENEEINCASSDAAPLVLANFQALLESRGRG